MKLRSSIFLKLLLVILPLVCVPIALVGYFAVRASVDRVDRLVRQEQMLKLEAAARTIDYVFYNCRLDLETITRLPILEDYQLARSFRLEAEEKFNYDNIVRIFSDFIERTPYYYRIVCLDRQGRELVKVGAEGPLSALGDRGSEEFLAKAEEIGEDGLYFSKIIRSEDRKGFIIQAAKPFYTGLRELAGVILIELDYEQIREIVGAIRIGEGGYAFLMDENGDNIAHPTYQPYEFGLTRLPDPSLKELIQEMKDGASGWGSYRLEGEEKMAAFAPVPVMNWSLAVTIPLGEFRKEAQAVQTRVVQVVILALILTVVGVSTLAYNLLKPVGNLVVATNRIAGGDLSHEIPVRSSDELGELTESFNRMVRTLSRTQAELVRSEKLILLGRVSAGLAHEIRNPLNAMKGAIVHLRRRRGDDALINEYTGLVLEEIDRLNRVVTEFLNFSRQAQPKPVATDINKLITSTETLFEEQAREKGIQLHNQLDPGLPEIWVDPDMMEQVLINVLINAMDALPDGGSITIQSHSLKENDSPDSRGAVRITIHDNGEGISAETLPSIFDPFFTTKDTGTGLGLPLSLGLVESHGGEISIVSRAGHGATVSIMLPFRTEMEETLEPS